MDFGGKVRMPRVEDMNEQREVQRKRTDPKILIDSL